MGDFEKFCENVYRESILEKGLTKTDISRLREFYKNTTFLIILFEAKNKIDYQPILECLGKNGLVGFKNTVCPNNDFEDTIETISDAIARSAGTPANQMLDALIRESGMNEDDFFNFCSRLTSNLEILKSVDSKLSEIVKNYLKTDPMSKSSNAIENDKDARSNILKKIAEIADVIRIVTTFTHNLFQRFNYCETTIIKQKKIQNFLRLALGENKLQPLTTELINEVSFDKFTPNASKIYRESAEVRNDSDNDTDNIS